MITLGVILLIAGFLLKISILWTLGIVALVVGAILAILGSTGRAIGGRRHYFRASDVQAQPGTRRMPYVTNSRLPPRRTGY